MAKRSTIGENPLDALVQVNPLDTVVPDLSVVAKTGRGQPAVEALAEIQERLGALEAGLKALKTELAVIKAAAEAATSLKAVLGQVQDDLARLGREVKQVADDTSTCKTLAAEVTQLKGELAQVRAGAGPGDLPWWMRGKKR
ncbi:MAG: hypothetical protein ACOZFS_01665 [Thermodesulfobacteriota bacterium]